MNANGPALPAYFWEKRFEVVRRLGQGAFGTVFEVYDHAHDCRLALKVLRGRSADALYQFKREFRTLVELDHPHLISLYELLCEDDSWFFTMELLEGLDLLTWLRQSAGSGGITNIDTLEIAAFTTGVQSGSALSGIGETMPAMQTRDVFDSIASLGSGNVSDNRPVPIRIHAPISGDRRSELCSAFSQLAEGLVHLHANGHLHRDVKPSNVLITPQGRVVLLDFGLVTEAETKPSSDELGTVVGTPAYMAPEQAILGTSTSAADWYSMGVMLYEALAGRLPFEGLDALNMMRSKWENDPPPPSTWAPDVPTDLEALCMELLSREPERRPLGQVVLDRLRSKAMTTGTGALTRARSSHLYGRDRHIAALNAALAETNAGNTVTVCLHGLSGMGKSALIAQFLRSVRSSIPNAVILSGRCFAQESVPYETLDGVVDELWRFLKGESAPWVRSLMPPDAPLIAKLFPVFEKLDVLRHISPDQPHAGDARELRRRATTALRELLRRIGEQRTVILYIDDLHWGDSEGATLLLELVRPPRPPQALMIFSYRSDEAETSPSLRAILSAWPPELLQHSLNVGELTPDEARDLARSLLGDEIPTADLPVEATRSPIFVHELSRWLSEEGGQRSSGIIPTLQELLSLRIQRKPESVKRALCCMALAGQPLPKVVLRESARLGNEELLTLKWMRSAHLARTRRVSEVEMVEVYHDTVRMAVVAGLDDKEAAKFHGMLATALERYGQTDSEALARHFAAAGIVDKAAEHLRKAVAHAMEVLAFDRAARLLREALRAESVPDRAALLRLLGDALTGAGRGAEAARAYIEAAALLSPDDAQPLRLFAGEQFLRSGFLDDGMTILRENLKLQNLRLASSPISAFFAATARRMLLDVRGLKSTIRPESEVPKDLLARIDTLFAVVIGFGMNVLAFAGDAQSQVIFLALKAGEPIRLVRALCLDAVFWSAGGLSRAARSAHVIERATEIAASHPDRYLLASLDLARGAVAYYESRFVIATRVLAEAEKRFRAYGRGVAWELEVASRCGLSARLLLGDLRGLDARVRTLLDDAVERDDVYAEATLRVTVAYHGALVRDDVGGAREHLEIAKRRWDNRGFHGFHYWFESATADILQYEGRYEDAFVQMSGEWYRKARQNMASVHQLVRLQLGQRRARAAMATALSCPLGSRKRKELHQVVKKDVLTMRAEGKTGVQWGMAMAAMLEGLMALGEGDKSTARERLTTALETFARVDMLLHANACRWALAHIADTAEAERLRDYAHTWAIEQEVQNPERLFVYVAPIHT